MPAKNRFVKKSAAYCALLITVLASQGCASFTVPVVDAIPVRRLPQEVLGPSKDELRPIPLDLLRQNPAKEHLVDTGDVIGVYIEGVLGERNQPIPIREIYQGGGGVGGTGGGAGGGGVSQRNIRPSLGFPVPVQEGGYILLPMIDPLKVDGLTIKEVQKAIQKACMEPKELLPKEGARIVVTLMQPRTYNVLVMRRDGTSPGASLGSNAGTFGQVVINNISGGGSSGFALQLPAYENDVLNALSRTGGLPSQGGKNEVLIQRSTSPTDLASPSTAKQGFRRIPFALKAGEAWPFSEDDITLKEGDIVYIEPREKEVFYTAGLLGVGQYVLPRDYDLDIIEAISIIRGPLLNGGFTQSGFGGQFQQNGIGNTNPAFAIILRKTPANQQISIRVDLNLAFRDLRERIRLLNGDIVILQQKPGEAFVNYFNQQFGMVFTSSIIRAGDLTGRAGLIVPGGGGNAAQ